MKKNLLSILALGGLLFASSCQMDEPDAGTLTGEVDFSITAGIPNGITTYADGAEAFSHQGGARNLNPTEYTLRYILQVFDEDEKVAYEEEKNPDSGTFGGVTFDVRLLAKNYKFVFWADFVKTEGEVEFYNVGNINILFQNLFHFFLRIDFLHNLHFLSNFAGRCPDCPRVPGISAGLWPGAFSQCFLPYREAVRSHRS